MTTAIFSHSDCLRHDTGEGHPERVARLEAVLAELKKPEYAALVWHDAPKASLDQIARVHARSYIDDVLAAVPPSGLVGLDADTIISAGSGDAALRAAGACIAATDAVIKGEITNAFCAVRPPGHHAEQDRAMGFCLFNNVAMGAAHALDAHKLKRVAIVDFDVHHGNGTQDWALRREDVLFCSTHQFPFYPGTGAAHEKGPKDNILNASLPHGADGTAFRRAMQDAILPAVMRFAPEMIFISAGFDAHEADPLAGLCFREGDYGWISSELCKIAKETAKGRVVSTLEGGYDLAALAASAGAHVKALMTAPVKLS
jgi:acetoin utilization deacetylase AcuC-like enzyme